MYRYLNNTDQRLIDEMRGKCSTIINEFKQEIYDEDYFDVIITLVGSGKRNLITQNGKAPIDLDYNLLIERYDDKTININSCREIKQYFIDLLNTIMKKHNFKNCEDSTSAITSPKFRSRIKKDTLFSFDIAITFDSNSGTRYRLIHKKTGNTRRDQWMWEPMARSKNIDKKVQWIKQNGYWEEIRAQYLNRKNKYLSKGDNNHPSYVCYIETINDVFNALKNS